MSVCKFSYCCVWHLTGYYSFVFVQVFFDTEEIGQIRKIRLEHDNSGKPWKVDKVSCWISFIKLTYQIIFSESRRSWIIRIYHVFVDRIDNSVPRVTACRHEALPSAAKQ